MGPPHPPLKSAYRSITPVSVTHHTSPLAASLAHSA
ncbi:hypothetical protein ACVIWV_005739 [Bradyrhizobium diazoefficiens]